METSEEFILNLAKDDASRAFASRVIAEMKINNRESNINLAQALWVHHRLRAITFTVLQAHADAFPPLAPLVGTTMTIDLMNLVISGDIETAYAALLCMSPDDMTQSYHFLSTERIGWLMNELGVYLGWI